MSGGKLAALPGAISCRVPQMPLTPGVRVPTKYHLAGGGRTLRVERATVDADVWLMEIKQ